MTKRHILTAVLFLILTVANGQSFVVNTVDGEQHWIDQKELRFSRDEVTSQWELMTPESFQTGIALTRISKLLREYKPDTVNIAVSVTEGQFTVSLDEAEVGSPCRLIFADLPTSISSVTVTDSTGAATTIHRSEFAKGIFIGNIIENNNRYRIEANRQDGSSIVLAGSVTVAGYYKWFAGKVATEQASEVDITRLEQSGFIKGSPFEIPEFDVTNWRCIALAVPSAKRVTLFHAVTDGFTSDMLSDDDYMSDTTKAYRNTTYKVVDVFADASTSKSTIKISVI